jgi:HTH-type transcriptional regulator, glycine betaine synthesis regulator
MELEVIDRFVESWGAMGSLWGVNTSVARIHGLLIASDQAWCLDDISRRLAISKSNVSTSLKELRTWNVIRKVYKPGDRREFYVCEPDAWKMLFNIMRERKRREFDPVVAHIKDTLESATSAPDGIALERLKQMEQMLATFDNLANKLLSSETQARAVIGFFMNKI